jgi:ABC-type metal ion transport system substrate-binding protein
MKLSTIGVTSHTGLRLKPPALWQTKQSIWRKKKKKKKYVNIIVSTENSKLMDEKN